MGGGKFCINNWVYNFSGAYVSAIVAMPVILAIETAILAEQAIQNRPAHKHYSCLNWK